MNDQPTSLPIVGQHVMPFEYAYKNCMLALRDLGWSDFPVAYLIAIGLKEHSCNPFMVMEEPLFNANMHEFTSHTGISQLRFFNLIGVQGLRKATQFPAFRFEPSWVKQAKALQAVASATDEQVYLMACSWGVGQKAGWIYLAEECQDKNIVQLKNFAWNPNLQWRQIAKDMRTLIGDSDGDLALAATKYNAGAGAHLVSSYGRRVKSLYQGVVAILEQEGMALCLNAQK